MPSYVPPLWGWIIYINYLEFFCTGDLSSLPHLYICLGSHSFTVVCMVHSFRIKSSGGAMYSSFALQSHWLLPFPKLLSSAFIFPFPFREAGLYVSLLSSPPFFVGPRVSLFPRLALNSWDAPSQPQPSEYLMVQAARWCQAVLHVVTQLDTCVTALHPWAPPPLLPLLPIPSSWFYYYHHYCYWG